MMQRSLTNEARATAVVLLVDTYIPDQRFSMYLFARCLLRHIPNSGSVDAVLVSPNQRSTGLFLKVLRKFILFPMNIMVRSLNVDVVHFCDTSHAIFLNVLPIKAIVTVHDLGAFKENRHKPSLFQMISRYLLVRGLRRAEKIVCVSTQSSNEVDEYVRVAPDRKLLIVNSTYQEFPHIDASLANTLLAKLDERIVKNKFIFHIGSNEARKNRRGVVRTLSYLRQYGDYRLVLAGYGADDELSRYIEFLGLFDSVIEVKSPTVDIIAALYKRSEALVFPSYYEGFGIPVAEAQINGCPVVCSDIPPHLEILKGTGLVADPDDSEKMAKFVVGLSVIDYREHLISVGRQNGQKYHLRRMIDEYTICYREMLRQH